MKNKTTARKSVHNYRFVIPSLLIVILFYTGLSSSGSEHQRGTTTHYYANLAAAFRNGKLYLTTKPNPQLLAMDNPYNLSARIELARDGVEIPVDYSLYDGKFYLYWGPVPALLLAILQPFSHQTQMGDFFLAFAFTVGIFFTQSLLLLAVWDRYFYDLPKWMLSLSILVGGFILPVTLLRHEQDHARVYEAAIAGGQFFLMGGLLMVFTAISRSSISNGRLAVAGSLWVLAIGSRHILIVPIAFMVLLTTFWLITTDRDFIRKAAELASLYLPLALGGVGLAWYNWARFGSITETGFTYALAGVDLQKHSTELFAGAYVLQNVYNYLLYPSGFMSTFPFVEMLKGSETSILSFYQVPKFYYAQLTTGLLYLFPFSIFAVVPLIAIVEDRFQKRSVKNSLEAGDHRLLAWIVLTLCGSILIAFFLLTIFFWAAMRYTGDFISPLAALSALGFWQGYGLLPNKLFVKILYIFAGIALAIISIFMGSLLAISTNAGLMDLILRRFPFLN